MRRSLGVATGLVLVLVSCGTEDVETRWIELEPELLFVTSCADEVEATVTESADEIVIDDVTGDPIEGDCLGSFPLVLEAPIGDRAVVVEGDRWQRLASPDCPDVEYIAPPGFDLSPTCFPQGP